MNNPRFVDNTLECRPSLLIWLEKERNFKLHLYNDMANRFIPIYTRDKNSFAFDTRRIKYHTQYLEKMTDVIYLIRYHYRELWYYWLARNNSTKSAKFLISQARTYYFSNSQNVEQIELRFFFSVGEWEGWRRVRKCCDIIQVFYWL